MIVTPLQHLSKHILKPHFNNTTVAHRWVILAGEWALW